MKIAIIIHNQADTGPYFKVLALAIAISQLGHDVTLLCTSRHSRWKPEEWQAEGGVNIVAFPDLLWGRLRQGPDVWNAFRRRQWLQEKEFDLVHAIDCRPNVIFPALSYTESHGVPLILSWWDLFGEGGLAAERSGKLYAATLGKIEAWLEVAFRNRATASTVISTFLKEKLVRLGHNPQRILLQYAGVDASVPVFTKEYARKKLGLEPEAVYFCFVGTMYASDFELYAEAMRRILRDYPHCNTIWVGNFAIPPTVCSDLNIYHAGKLPTLEDVQLHIAAADMCLLPMRVNIANKARWHSKVTDYWNAARPVITTPVSDFPQIFAKHDVGWLAADDTPESLEAALRTALQEPPAVWHDKGVTAKEFVRNELDVRKLAEELLAFYVSKEVCEPVC